MPAGEPKEVKKEDVDLDDARPLSDANTLSDARQQSDATTLTKLVEPSFANPTLVKQEMLSSLRSLFPPPPLQPSLPPRPLVKRYSIQLNAAASSKMGSLLKASSNVFQFEKVPFLARSKTRQVIVPKRVAFRLAPVASSLSASTGTVQHDPKSNSPDIAIPIMVNGCTGKMGKSVIKAADSAGLHIVPVSFGSEKESGQTVELCGKEILVHGPSERESILASVFQEYPNLVVVDYTVPATVNDNAELYCKVGVPFVMGTTGGDRDQLHKTVEESKVYTVISPQMGKQVVAFLAAMEIMAEQFPGAFSGYSLQVMESHQTSKLDTSGTAKAIISCFQKLGVSFDMDQIQMIRDPKQQVEMVGVPEEHLAGHAFHLYHLTSPDQTVSFEFQHNVCGRSIYAEGTVDAVLFLAKKVKSKADKRIYNMIDVLREAGTLGAAVVVPSQKTECEARW
ncbi:hypothetical protein V6N12_031119 [Hibiscus sabdariffa]|uniref:4-hydroxy-tetrahydrodipicolinate reductase n=1 Tax=Hibiscus sabdariffa TaxID=183260 RepID=A0ABR2EA04_9ROSI